MAHGRPLTAGPQMGLIETIFRRLRRDDVKQSHPYLSIDVKQSPTYLSNNVSWNQFIQFMCKHTKAVLSSTKFPKDVCGIINEFCDHHGLIETRLYLNESIKFAYQDWLDSRLLPGLRNNEIDCKMSIYTRVRPGDVDEMWKIRQRIPPSFLSKSRVDMEYFHDSIQGDDFLSFFRES